MTKKMAPTLSLDDLSIETWFERDRSHVELINNQTDETIIEWWNEEVHEAIEDGFLDPKDYLESAADYAESIGLIKLND